MTGFRNFVVDAIEQIERATAPDIAWRAVKAFAAEHGFGYMLALRARDSLIAGVSDAILYNDMPLGFAEAFDGAGFSRDNPLVLHAMGEARPYSAGELWTMPLTVRQRRALAQLNLSLDVLDGLIIPIRLDGRLTGIVLLGGNKPVMTPVVRSALHLFAHCAFDRVLEIENRPRQRESSLLSPRELECLSWAAGGKTDVEIGRILAISPRTARFHIENAKKKLGVATRVQAVAEALRIKAIAA